MRRTPMVMAIAGQSQIPVLTGGRQLYYRPVSSILRAAHASVKSLSLKLPDDLDARLAALAAWQGASKSEVVRNALDAYLARGDAAAPGSALELAGDLVGAFDGPEDLSHADQHMDGYGA